MEEEKQEKGLGKNARIAFALLIIGALGLGGILTWTLNVNPTAACNTSANMTELVSAYNAGYYTAVADMVKEAYSNGIIRIPYNSTHNFALVPWSEGNG